jgi:hypothetical protein
MESCKISARLWCGSRLVNNPHRKRWGIRVVYSNRSN